MLLQVSIERTFPTITQRIPYSPYDDKYNIGTTCPLLTEVRLQTIDPPTEPHALDSSVSLFLVFGLHAAFSYHTALGPYTTYYNTSSTLGVPI